MTVIVARDRPMAAGTPRGSPPTSVTSDASMATSAPVPMAMPRSAWASAGASLMPSPTMATVRPRPWSRSHDRDLVGGQHLGQDAGATGMPTCAATASAVPRASPVTSQTSMPAAVSSRTAGRRLGLDRVADGEQAGERGRRWRRARSSGRRGRGALDRPRRAARGRRPALEQPPVADEDRRAAQSGVRPCP